MTELGRLGSYELLRPLAQGGMADLYLARRRGESPVALKVLNEARAREPDARAMFRDEARVLGLLDHPNIIAARDVDTADGRHFLALDYVHGVDLRALLLTAQRAGVAVPYDAAIAIVAAAAAGLDHAHRRAAPDGTPLRLVHRDVSLSNIMVGHDGSVKLIDFGIASTTIASVATVPGVVRGKASYMSPEQCMGAAIDHRSDLFALGAVLYELTLGARCFHGKTDFERMLAVVKVRYTEPRALCPDYPAALDHVVRTALARAPGDRFASAAAMLEALPHADAGAIRRLMRDLFGAVDEPAPSQLDDAAVTEPHSFMPAWLADEIDDRTHGRGPLRRPSRARIAA